MVHASLRNYRKQERFTGPRRPRYKSLIEARKDAELPAGEFEIHHDGSRRRRDAGDSRVGQRH